MLAMDTVYISAVKGQYAKMVYSIQRGQSMVINVTSAILCYLVLAAGLVFLVFPYAKLMLQSHARSNELSVKIKVALLTGGLAGFLTYGVFNTTNVALFKNYRLDLALIDTVWGSLLFFVSTLVYLVYIGK
jgi:uncharacterized membrane protein